MNKLSFKKINLENILMLAIYCSSVSFATELPDYIKSCADCHGENGISNESDIPIIAGASDIFISESLNAYKSEIRIAIESKYRDGDISRTATDMQKLTNEMTDQQIDEIAVYFSQQPFIPAKQDFDAKLVDKGSKIHDRRCKKCHEDGGSSVDDDSGILAGQWTPYLRDALKLYRSGERHMQKKMKVKIDKLNDQQVEALLNYYASQQ